MTDPKVALVTTTINVPTVLSLYRACDPDVRFFVAGDEKTPAATGPYVEGLGNARYIPPADQTRWECSGYIGMNCIQRRNIATLEALEWGADIVVLVDDDNIPVDLNYFDSYVSKLMYPFSGPCVHGFNNWFDPGKLLQPPVQHRGFPFGVSSSWGVKGAISAKVGVCAGLCLGNPDVESVTRMTLAPEVHGFSEIARAGVVVDPFTFTVYNSQNSAFARELAPAMFLAPGIQRYDDIFASLITQRIMREFGQHIHIGAPAVFQDRNQHNIVTDLKNEIFGIEHVESFAAWLNDLGLCTGDVLAKADFVYNEMEVLPWMPSRAYQAGQAFMRDMEKVL